MILRFGFQPSSEIWNTTNEQNKKFTIIFLTEIQYLTEQNTKLHYIGTQMNKIKINNSLESMTHVQQIFNNNALERI